ncbi:hypothetical protein G1K75_12455 [Tenacibaculum finnmarkense]|uniref:hypothetical protein n=1 Tax=Tenacibaculum finnmarkense TaxID=2781243 RepID=UPI001E2BF26F|nr:hypothetical protein [Tenacibaculum finnmarkense]MCD8455103.1 hypothetical protein [Tenacibaculum finnmarkense genomovar ulcerans]MCG8806463.1 hypothetical protein [Tenacibaculum finnmarkense]MCG8857664.1 hypothetical protein [Tenacibaculum finnmarkense]
MARIHWKENKILSIETRKGLYVLAQMIAEPYLVFYNTFNTNQDWGNVDLENIPVLFHTAVAREFLNFSNITTIKSIKANKKEDLNPKRIKTESIYRNVKTWEGTDKEIDFLIKGEGGILIEKSPYVNVSFGEEKVLKHKIDAIHDSELIDDSELERILFSPGLNERLFLCYKYGKNVDPLKDLIFNRDIPLDYEVYIKLYADKMTEKEWEELSI